MLFKRISLFIASLLLLTGCASVTHLIPKSVQHNVLSGREGANGPMLAVKIDDTNQAHPQIGLEDADVVYIEQVEGGLTRLAAIFSSTIPERVGPVRSARISDIDILHQYGRVAFAYSGAQKKLLPVIESANLQNMGAQSQPPSIYTTDPNRIAPVAMVLRADLLMEKIAEKKYQITSANNVGWSFGEAPQGGKPTQSVLIRWPAARYRATWSQKEKRWLLEHNASIDVSESGKTLGPTTLVIQMVAITPSEYHDKVGGITPFSQTVGSGHGYILRDGKTFAALWNRASAEVGTTWTSEDGSEIKFAAGQVWVALTDTEPDFTYVTASADSTKTK
ncbi:MAG: DUF3048 domain-containing protein [Actinobacteria bacterium]|uniref:Unannotated protein n=1 Tax=freshwater metagenome TaxID=449393 RepID=A0A6J5YVP4_9ZZZZ|nr:DUF3048 domain-containing protein [Actinomycetota bacterium]MSX71308.1 DUF3048 domain-containing protein [Actinomycetota bacterium]MSY69194.1 DUF3048 domain-containing protein [Actinomycetota bacterium]MTA75545.1 DUF3048 domain-containing protein [Actinomycetota bacterium]